MTSQSYSDLLRDPRWQEKREHILKRDSFECTACYHNDNLHIHHKEYHSGCLPWEYEDRFLVTLCAVCHTSEHERLEQIKEIEKERKNSIMIRGKREGIVSLKTAMECALFRIYHRSVMGRNV